MFITFPQHITIDDDPNANEGDKKHYLHHHLEFLFLLLVLFRPAILSEFKGKLSVC